MRLCRLSATWAPITNRVPDAAAVPACCAAASAALCETADHLRARACRKGRPAFAVCLSGGYEDDSDTGARFQYTGEGGQSGGRVCPATCHEFVPRSEGLE